MVLSAAWADHHGTAIWISVNHGKTPAKVTVRLRVDDARIEVLHHETVAASGWRGSRPGWRELELSRVVPLSGIVVQL